MSKGPTFKEWTEAKMADAKFAKGYRKAKDRVDAVDRLIRTLDGYRLNAELSKAELARSIDAKPEIVRRLLTKQGANPTLETFVEIAAALGLEVHLVPKSKDAFRKKPRQDVKEALKEEPRRVTETRSHKAPVVPESRAAAKKSVAAHA